MTTPPPGSGGPPPGTPDHPRRGERIALIVAAIGATAAIIAAIIQAAPDLLSGGDPPGGTTPTASPPPATEAPGPDPTTTAPEPSTNPPAVPPPAGPVSCTPDLGDEVTVLDVRSNDGGTGIGGSLIVTVQVNLPAASGGAYWLMVHLPNDPRPIEIARQPLSLEQTQEIPVAISAGPGSVRTFYVAEGDRQGIRWFEENKAHDGDSSWDGYRVALPQGVRSVSNRCQVIRTE